MAQVKNWFERKFDFSFPVELYPNVCARLRGAPARLEELLRSCPRERLIRKAAGNKWSAQEHAGHLLDLEPLWLARVEDYATGAPELSVADLTNRQTDEADHNAKARGYIATKFREERLKLVDRADKMDQSLFARAIVHPRLKQPMRLVDHLYFVAEHDDHHVAKIWEILSAA